MREDLRSRKAEAANREPASEDSDDGGPYSAPQAVDLDKLEYLTDMIAELRDMAQELSQSSLPAILDSALIEARIYRTRRRS